MPSFYTSNKLGHPATYGHSSRWSIPIVLILYLAPTGMVKNFYKQIHVDILPKSVRLFRKSWSILFAILSTLCYGSSYAQNGSPQHDSTTVTSTIRGEVVSASSHLPVLRARVAIQSTKLGALTNAQGEYRITNVPVGHYIITISAVGFSPSSQEVVVGSGHQVVLNIILQERIIQGDTISVTGSEALTTINRVAAVSATPFSVQDVNRYAGAFQDPSRMAQNFAGVFGRGTTNNYIVVRGGSPIELLWRLDGIDIPNPNHFGKDGSSGGLISAIDSYILGNSDFLTGAFPAEYGTKLSAVFDLHTRNGNTEQPEGMAQISFNGLQGLGEGPIPGLTGSSFLLSYRHSTIGFLRQIGLLDYDNLPDFDDASMKLHVAVGEHDQLNATGLWGSAHIDASNTQDEEIGQGSGILVGGVTWQHLFSEQLLGHVYLNYAGNRYDEGLGRSSTESTTISYTTAKGDLSFTPNLTHNFELGFTAQRLRFNLDQRQDFSLDTSTAIYQSFLNWNWHIIPELVLNSGLFTQFIQYNHSSSYEPRLSLAWSPVPEHTFAVAYGVHRQPEPLEFAQAIHYVAGYTFRPDPDIMIKAEGYYKDYSRVPVHASTLDSYSFLNAGFAERIDFSDLVNKGRGRSYGAELTLLKHYVEGYYITATTSLVRQEFAGSDSIWHFGTFDNRYIVNLLAGYDFSLGSSSVLTLSEKFSFAGGGTYTPYDMQRSYEAEYGILDSTHAFGARNPPYVRLDINAEFHFNWRTSSLTIFASVLNALAIKNALYRYYQYPGDGNPPGSIGYNYDLPILPILGIRYEF